MRPSFLCLSSLFFVGITAASLPAQQYVWLEGETPTRATVKFETGGWGRAEYLSGGKWLFANIEPKDIEAKIPADGAVISYDFDAKTPGDYEVWARVGHEFVRSPFSWRLDGGAWKLSKSDDLTTDLMALQAWNEVAWLKLGKAGLQPGKHTFEIKYDRQYKTNNGKKEPERLLFDLDAICLYKGAFLPNGQYKPDEKENKEIDKQGGAQVFAAKDGAGGARGVTSLGGAWQIARIDEQEITNRTEPVKELSVPADQLHWKGIKVPGNRDDERPDLLYAHRFVYRTRIDVPADSKGRSFFLHFPCTAVIASAFVNGKYCGGSKAPCTVWDCDVTQAVEPGKVNEILVAIKDSYYAIANTGDPKRASARYMFNVPPDMFYGAGGVGMTRYADLPVLTDVRGAGLFEAPSFVVAGKAYTSDVFAMPSVKKKELGLEISVHNPTDAPLTVKIANEVAPQDGGVAEKELTVAPGKEETIKLSEKWDNPKLWWPDDPKQYIVTTRLFIGDKVTDVKKTKFGFREWEWSGQHFTLNGVPWHLHADLLHNDGPIKDPEKAVKDWKKAGDNTFRYWGYRPWTGKSQEATLDFFDAHGTAVRRSSIFDGEVAPYLLVDNGKARTDLFDNWRTLLRAWVKAERNHPSIFIWSVENEITYINARNLGWLPQEEPEIQKGIDMVMALDPTRPAMTDGGDAGLHAQLPIYGNHYNEFNMREYPDEAYTMAKALKRRDPWPIGDDKPLFLGESFFASGYTPSAFSSLSGESAFLGWPEARKGVGLFAKMLAEGYRWHGVAGFQFWFGPDRADLHWNSFQPVCVLCREWNNTFAAGQKVMRTLKVFNDTHDDEPIEITWSVMTAKRLGDQGKQTFHLKPGTAEETHIEFTAPRESGVGRNHAQLTLTCRRGGKEVFREVKSCWIIDPDGAAKPALAKDELVIFDPKGVVKERLTKRGVAFTEAAALDALPAKMRVLVVGPDALTARQATDPMWRALAVNGVRVLVLDQDNPLHYQAAPADLEVTDHVGRVAFPENLTHPIFNGLGQEDFFTWSRDHVVYRNAYKKASRGARSLLQCDDDLSCSAISECGVKDGLLLLCQAVVGSKLEYDPAAQHLFDNMLDYCAAYKPAAKQSVVVLDKNDLRLKLLDASGLKHGTAADVLQAISDDHAEIVVADATPVNLKMLAANADAVKKFTDRGGWLMLWGLTPAGLADFNKVVGVNHVIRPFRMERVTLPPVRDPLLSGLTTRDVVLESTKRLFPWSGDVYQADDEFTNVVDLDDAAPFCNGGTQQWAWTLMTNGLTTADAWVYVFSQDLKADPHPKWTAQLPKEEEVVDFTIVPNAIYHRMTKMRLIFHADGGDESETIDLKPENTLQDFPLKPHRCKSITLEPLAWDEAGTAPVIGVDNLWIRVKRSEQYQREVVPLLNIGALVKYKTGEGGVILNDLKVQESESNPVNAQKKQNIAATLLRNLGAAFADERVVTAGANLKYQPIPLAEKCNQFLTREKGWYDGDADLSAFPVGENTLSGVRYVVRDFRTSPLPACVMLSGPGVHGKMPEAVEGIPANCKADALFFLHTFRQDKEWKPSNEAKEPPTVFEYVVHYADGKTVVVPVKYGGGVGNWIEAKPQGIPEAAVAWAAPLTKDAGKSAVVYQMQWTNPQPNEAIATIDIRYGAKVGNQYGVPALLAITAGTATK
jgi:Glycosyl hydrolases family 2/Glycosyl hydrolases family 2, TIM barrel domain